MSAESKRVLRQVAVSGYKADPRALVEPLVGHCVKITTTSGARREGVVIGCGPSGFQLTSGIGGRMVFSYGGVDAIEDLGEATQ